MRQAAVAIALAVAAAPSCAVGLCTADEEAVFSCAVAGSGKTVSLCASKPLEKDRGALVYRFGRPGRVELAFPDAAAGSLAKFRHAHYMRSRVDRSEVSFTRDGHDYAVFDYSEAEDKKPTRLRGVAVQSPGAPQRQLLCAGPATARLQSLEGIVPCDADNALASCR